MNNHSLQSDGDLGSVHNKKKGFILVLFSLALFFFVTFISGSFEPVVPSGRLIIFNLVFLSLLSILFFRYGYKRGLLFLVPYAVAFLILEIGVHIWVANFASSSTKAAFLTPFSGIESLNAKSTYIPHHYTLYNLRPNLKKDDGTIHNGFGLRDDRNFSDSDKNTRIVFIGGSTTYTVGLKDNKDIFSYRLENLLKEHYKNTTFGQQIQVINAGMPGATSAENLLRLIFFVSEVKPDLVVIQHGLNDIWPRIRKNITTDFSNYRKLWESPDYYSNAPISYGLIRKLIENSVVLTFFARRFEILPQASVGDMVVRKDLPFGVEFLEKNGTQYFERNTRFMIAVCRSIGSQVVLVTEAYSKEAKRMRLMAMPEHNKVLRGIAEEEGLLFFDFYEEMTKEKRYMPDGRHLNQAGSDLKADLFLSFFTSNNILPILNNN